MSNEKPPSIVLPIVAMLSTFCCFPLAIALAVISLIKFHNAKGSTALTLSIVALAMSLGLAVPLTGIYAAIAIPNFVKYQCRSKQARAKVVLSSIYASEQSFKAMKNQYTTNLDELRFAPPPEGSHDYAILDASATSFRAEARGRSGSMLERDVWLIDERGEPVNVENGCQAR
jgi:type IV pilus assembly protein PilA